MTALEQWDDEHRPTGITIIEPDPTDELVQHGAPPVERWRVEDDSAADWCMRKLARLKRTMAANAATADEERARIDAWLDDVNMPILRDVAFFEGILRDYMRRSVDDDLVEHGGEWKKVRKTVKLPHGELVARKSSGRFSVDNAEATIAFAERLSIEDQLLTWKPSVTATQIGELPTVREHDGRFYVWMCGDLTGETFADPELHRVLDGDAPLAGEGGRWVPIPGIARTGEGQITYTVKAGE